MQLDNLINSYLNLEILKFIPQYFLQKSNEFIIESDQLKYNSIISQLIGQFIGINGTSFNYNVLSDDPEFHKLMTIVDDYEIKINNLKPISQQLISIDKSLNFDEFPNINSMKPYFETFDSYKKIYKELKTIDTSNIIKTIDRSKICIKIDSFAFEIHNVHIANIKNIIDYVEIYTFVLAQDKCEREQSFKKLNNEINSFYQSKMDTLY
ncbi:hypothetical protein WICMUC_002594 [Wickerhamomyces mucosus]|uniref:Uncharacterized protein n=1 Tax=Wickerhamomyces mucosus TaxID=1378264 RepID=A0A9P8PP28_9ASCO|nr:hypothetical protein WICMUC_002594 [Wickerhamomyces mucosus]